jgi:hypothetical protein
LLVAEPYSATGGGHGDQETIVGQFHQGVWIGRAGLSELVRCDPQAGVESLRQNAIFKSISMFSIVRQLLSKTLQNSFFLDKS